MVESDHMEVGDVVPMPNGWFKDKDTGVVFRFDEEGHAVGEDGNLLLPMFEHDDDEA